MTFSFIAEPIMGVVCGCEYLSDEEMSMVVVALFIIRLTFFWEPK